MKYWDEIDIYAKIKNKKTNKRFLFHYGPPFTNNNFHLGHALTITLKDIIARYFTMMNYEVPILQGHDCHGYPIECEVQKIIEKEDKNLYTIQKVRQLCREYSKKWSAIHKQQTKKLGVLTNLHPKINEVDKNDEITHQEFYSTMDKDVELNTYKFFSDLILAGKVYRGMKPVMWSIAEQSTLAEVDVVYKTKKSTSVYVKLKITDTLHKELENCYVVFWTTTPWTIISNLGVAFNKNITYVPLIIDGHKCFVAQNLEMDLIKKWDCTHTVVESDILVKGEVFEGSKVEHPLIEGKKVPLIPSDHVAEESGSGFVHIAPDHGEEDFELGKKYQLGLCEFVDGSGYYREETPLLSGFHIFKNEAFILDLLLPKLLSKEEIEHSYPFSDRSNSPLIYICTEQIFINLIEAKTDLLKTITTVKWFPPKGENRITAFVKNRGDWCVSRQRVWGNPLLIFVHKTTGEVLKNEKTQQTILAEIKKNGTDHLFEIDWSVFLEEELKVDYRPVYGILDCWFDSGATFETIIHERYGTDVSDLYLEGSDQHRGWFQSSLSLSVLKNKKAPYKNVVTHGFLVDEKGHKISKSKKNGLPLEECLSSGVDIIRVWVATSDFHEDLKISKSIFEDKIEIYRKVRNILRYLLGATGGMTTEELNYKFQDTDYLEMYILHKAHLLQKSVETHIHEFKVKEVFDEIFKFMQDLSVFYLDIKKDILYCDGVNSRRRQATRKTQHLLLDFLLRLLNPFIPFTVEEVALELGISSYQLQDIFLFPESLGSEEYFDYIQNLRATIPSVKIAIEKARQNKIINSNNEAVLDIPLFNFQTSLPLDVKKLLEEILMVAEIVDTSTPVPIHEGMEELQVLKTINMNHMRKVLIDIPIGLLKNFINNLFKLELQVISDGKSFLEDLIELEKAVETKLKNSLPYQRLNTEISESPDTSIKIDENKFPFTTWLRSFLDEKSLQGPLLLEEILIIAVNIDKKLNKILAPLTLSNDQVKVYKTHKIKCERCWRYQGNLCDRCQSFIA